MEGLHAHKSNFILSKQLFIKTALHSCPGLSALILSHPNFLFGLLKQNASPFFQEEQMTVLASSSTNPFFNCSTADTLKLGFLLAG